jgi:hypothetical protein
MVQGVCHSALGSECGARSPVLVPGHIPTYNEADFRAQLPSHRMGGRGCLSCVRCGNKIYGNVGGQHLTF